MSDNANAPANTPGTPDAGTPGTPENQPANEQKVLTDAEKAQAAAADKAAAEIAKAGAAKQPEEVVYEYTKTGDAGLDIALEFVGKRGIPAEHAAMQAAVSGDFTALEATLQTLGDKAKGYEPYLALAKTAFENRTKAAAAHTAASEAAVYQAVGGKDTWDKIAAHTKANADEGERVHIEAAMKAGGLQAQSMALLLKQAWERGNPKTPGVARNEASGAGGVPTGKMSISEYQAKVRAIRGKSQGPIDSNPEYLALRKAFAQQQ